MLLFTCKKCWFEDLLSKPFVVTQATYERKISEDLLSFIDRLLVLAPDKRLSPSVALNSSE